MGFNWRFNAREASQSQWAGLGICATHTGPETQGESRGNQHNSQRSEFVAERIGTLRPVCELGVVGAGTRLKFEQGARFGWHDQLWHRRSGKEPLAGLGQ